MKRLTYFAALMLLSSSAQAGNSLSLLVGGRSISVDARQGCVGRSCVSWSLSRYHAARHRRGGGKDVAFKADAMPSRALVAQSPAPSVPVQAQPAPMPTQAAPSPLASAPIPQPAPPFASAVEAGTPRAEKAKESAPWQPSSGTVGIAASSTQSAPPPQQEPVTVAGETPVPASPSPAAIEETRQEHATPVGDWQTDGGKGLVRIEPCGALLCGYLLDPLTGTMGEIVLSNMKASGDGRWAGEIYSRASGNVYYAEISLKEQNALRVEACALGRFLCSGNHWTRVLTKQDQAANWRVGPD